MTQSLMAQRWLDDPEWKARLAPALAWLTGESKIEPDLPRIDGRYDLRGIPFRDPGVAAFGAYGDLRWATLRGLSKMKGVCWEGLDLSHASLNSLRFSDSRITECTFGQSKARDWRLWNSTVSNCTFEAADLWGSALGTSYEGRVNIWENVSFQDANLDDTAFMGGRLENCTVGGRSRTRGASFMAVELMACTFLGSWSSVEFNGRLGSDRAGFTRMQNCDFTRAVLRDVEMLGYAPSNVVMPSDPDVLLVENYPVKARSLASQLSGASDSKSTLLMGVLKDELRTPNADETAFLLNLHDFAEVAGREFAEFVRDAFATA